MSIEADLNAALAKALGRRPTDIVVDYGLPRASSEAELLAKAGATFWAADRGYLRQTAGKVHPEHAQTAKHPEGERVDVPPPALVASARLP